MTINRADYVKPKERLNFGNKRKYDIEIIMWLVFTVGFFFLLYLEKDSSTVTYSISIAMWGAITFISYKIASSMINIENKLDQLLDQLLNL